MISNGAVRNLIREGKVAQMMSAMQTGAKDGMKTLDQTLDELVRAGTISKEEARSHATDRSKFM